VTVALAAVAGLLAGRVVWLLLRPLFRQQLFLRENWRGRTVTTAVGVVLPLGLVVVEAGRAVAGAAGAGEIGGLSSARLAVVITVVGFGLLGLLDDLAGVGDARGLRGHLATLAGGRLTTGGVKLLGGVAVALVAVAPGAGRNVGRLVVDGLLVASAANLGNLLDRRPGRVGKAALAAFVGLAAAVRADAQLADVAVVIGAAAGLLVDDLHERLMLGDTGANVLGAALGLGVVLTCGPATRAIVLVVVLALNGLSEVVSFTRIIDAVPPFRALDQMGRRD
jgi:UDP-N-acetylmuramyl pentapeptide phosphotransferase/UDP-N-acetylglucosamine-1-phosphate transferase